MTMNEKTEPKSAKAIALAMVKKSTALDAKQSSALMKQRTGTPLPSSRKAP